MWLTWNDHDLPTEREVYTGTGCKEAILPPVTPILRGIILSCLVLAFLIIPASAGNGMNSSAPFPASTTAVVHIGVYVVDLKDFSVEEGTYSTNFYLNLVSDSNVSIDDFELMNGHITSIDTITDTPHEKNYRIFAVMTADPSSASTPSTSTRYPSLSNPRSSPRRI